MFSYLERYPIMEHVPLPSVPKRLLQAASAIQEDPTIPATVPAETFAFLHRLGTHGDHSSKPLGQFLLTTLPSQFTDSLLRVILPNDYHELRDELEERQRGPHHELRLQTVQRSSGIHLLLVIADASR